MGRRHRGICLVEDSAYFHNEGHGWSRYPEDHSRLIVEAYEQGLRSLVIKLPHRHCAMESLLVDLNAMQQINLKTEVRRPIKVGSYDHEEVSQDHFARLVAM